jgi:membrane-bound lytic murein transglycosylase D
MLSSIRTTCRRVPEEVYFMKSTLFFILFGLMLFPSTNAHCEEFKGTHLPPLISSLRVSAPLFFCGEKVPIEIQDIKERLEKELLLTLWDRPQVILWLKRSGRYMPIIEKLLRENNMPDDLKYLAIAESALRPHVSSEKGAIGFWQFIKETGLKYGLIINEHIDERRNVISSTRAAIRYFEDLHDKFGSWTLAAAAYNMGDAGLEVQMQEQEEDDYFHLYLPIETQRFVFRVISAKLICSNPEQYGFYLSDEDYYPPMEFEVIQLNCPQDIPIRIVALAADTHFKVIKDLNPEVRGHYLAKGNHYISVPKGSAKGFHARYQELVTNWRASKKEFVYIVKKGDNLSFIAEEFGVPLAALMVWNKLDPKAHIFPGDRLIIHKKEEKTQETDETIPGNDQENL